MFLATTPRSTVPAHVIPRVLGPVASYAALLVFLLQPVTTPALAQAQAQEVKKPKLTVEERQYQTEAVARDQVVEHTFKISNTGTAPLTIKKIMLAPNVELVSRPSILAPGEAGGVTVRVPLLYDKAAALLKQIELQSDDPEIPSLVLELRILSTEYVVAKPGFARWISVQHEKRGIISQLISAIDGQDFKILGTSALPTGITSSIAPSKEGPGKWKLDLTLDDDAPVGPIVGTLLVQVNHPKQSVVPIPLSGFMRPVAAVTPNALSVGDLELATKKSQAFTVKFYSTEPVHVTKVEHDLKGAPPASLETRMLGREYRVRLEFDPATMPKGVLRGTLSIFTDSAKVPVLKVPIDGTIR